MLSHYTPKLTVSLQSAYNNLATKNSPYGMFSDYVKMNPYDSPTDEFGDFVQRLSWDFINPLYEATTGSYGKGGSNSFTNSVNVRWNILPNLFLTSNGTIALSNTSNETFLSPLSAQFRNVSEVEKRGSLGQTYGRSLNYSGNMVINFNKNIGANNLLTTHIGADIFKDESLSSTYNSIGFYKSNLHSPQFAASYPENGKPSGSHDISSRLGVFANANFITKNKYFVDATIRRSGSSKFGANNRYAPFWSVGAGWNMHNEGFMKEGLFELMRLRYSYGVTGNISFSPYQAITTYAYNSDLYYLHGVGAIPKQMGNPDLSWQSTYMHNVGLTSTFLKNKVNLSIDYYVKTTDDLLMDQTIPPSVGESTIKTNMGKIQNKGIEIDLGAELLKTPDWRVYFRINGAHNANKILAISNALKKQNDLANAKNSAEPLTLFEEGHSTTAIYAVPSAGINPADGREIFIKKDGRYTLTYDAKDKVVMGDAAPSFEGAFFPSIYYKNWSLTIAASYRLGGQVYNSTRAANVETVDPKYNVDQRAFDQRWKNKNDIAPYLDIVNTSALTYKNTSRFIENDNTIDVRSIQVAYEFGTAFIKGIGLKRLRVGVGMNEPFRISTVKYERGTSYPFSRGFSFMISPTF